MRQRFDLTLDSALRCAIIGSMNIQLSPPGGPVAIEARNPLTNRVTRCELDILGIAQLWLLGWGIIPRSDEAVDLIARITE